MSKFVRMRVLLLLLLFSGFSVFSSATAVTDNFPAGDSAKVKSKPTEVQPVNRKKKEDDAPISIDFSKKTLRFNLFGNTLDIDFKKRNMEVNKDKKEEEDLSNPF
jgi:hypothetical protein